MGDQLARVDQFEADVIGQRRQDGTIVDQEWGRSLLVPAPDGTVIQIDEQDRELYT